MSAGPAAPPHGAADPDPSRRRLVLVMLGVLVLVVLVVGVGVILAFSPRGGNADADPATVAPAGAILYLSAEVRPEDEQRDQILAAAGKVLDTPDPEQRIYELLEGRVNREARGGVYRRDVDPWLGRRVGIFFTSLGDRSGPREPDGAVIAASQDTGRSAEFLERVPGTDRQLGEPREYKGVAYRLETDGDARGMVGDFAVEGSESGFKGVVDASQGASLAESARFKGAAERVEGAVAYALADMPALIRSAVAGDPTLTPDDRRGLEFIGRFFSSEPLVLALGVRPDALSIDLAARQSPVAAALPDPAGASERLGALPADSGLALVSPGLGEQIDASLTATDRSDPDYQQSLREFRSTFKVDVEREIFPALGDLAGFARGSSPTELNGGVVIELEEPRVIARLLRRAQSVSRETGGDLRPTSVPGADVGVSAIAPGTSTPVEVALRDERLIVAYGEAAGRDSVDPSQTLAESPLFRRAVAALGSDLPPTSFLDAGPALALARAQPAPDPDLERALPYLDAASYVVVGQRRAGPEAEARLVVGLR